MPEGCYRPVSSVFIFVQSNSVIVVVMAVREKSLRDHAAELFVGIGLPDVHGISHLGGGHFRIPQHADQRHIHVVNDSPGRPYVIGINGCRGFGVTLCGGWHRSTTQCWCKGRQ